MNREAAQIIINLVAEAIAARPISQQVEIYRALAEHLPTRLQQQSARAITTSLDALLKMQRNLQTQILRELQSDQLDGDGDGREAA